MHQRSGFLLLSSGRPAQRGETEKPHGRLSVPRFSRPAMRYGTATVAELSLRSISKMPDATFTGFTIAISASFRFTWNVIVAALPAGMAPKLHVSVRLALHVPYVAMTDF